MIVEEKMKRKALVVILSLLIAAIGALTIRLFVVSAPLKATPADTKAGVALLKSMNKKSANEAEDNIRAIHEKYEAAQERKKLAEAIKAGNYNYVFKDVVISGDSMVEAIAEYSILSPSDILAKVGAGTVFLHDNIGNITERNPKYLVLHYGENQIGTTAQAEALINAYSKSIKTLKKNLPNTKIFIDGIFPVSPKAYKQNSYLKNIPYYNNALKKMASSLGVTYLDYDALWNSFTKNYYDGDGMHPTFSFYTEQYLPYLVQKAGIGIK